LASLRKLNRLWTHSPTQLPAEKWCPNYCRSGFFQKAVNMADKQADLELIYIILITS
jgi:hypothetical protein